MYDVFFSGRMFCKMSHMSHIDCVEPTLQELKQERNVVIAKMAKTRGKKEIRAVRIELERIDSQISNFGNQKRVRASQKK